MATYKIEGMKELEKKIKKLEILPQRVVTKAAKRGMTIALKAAKQGRFKDKTGNLRKNIILMGEKLRKRGKKVYQVTIKGGDEANSLFQRKTSTGLVKDKKTGKSRKGVYYYPASIEYGFYHVNSGKNIPGYRYLKEGMDNNAGGIKKEIIGTMTKEIDKVLAGGK
jgi:hypothetical protein